MQEAMQRVKMDLGSEAVIISSKKVKPKGLFGFLKKPLVEVLAAVDDDRLPTKRNLSQRQGRREPSYSQQQMPQQNGQRQETQQYQPMGQQPAQPGQAQQYQPMGQQPAQPGQAPQYQPMVQQPAQPGQAPQYQPMGQQPDQPGQTQQFQPLGQHTAQSGQSAQPQRAQQDQGIGQAQQQQASVMHHPVAASQVAKSYMQNKTFTPHESSAAEPNTNKDKDKITELEDKLKDLEITLDKVFKAVSTNKSIEDVKPQEQDSIKETDESINLEHTIIDDIINEEHPQNQTQEPQVSDNIAYLRRLLFDRDVEPKLIEKILEKIRERGGNSMKKEDMLSLTSKIMTLLMGEPEPIYLEDKKKPYVVIFLGPTGVGKTTTLAKLAAEFTFKNKKVGLITADTYRIAAVEQLKTYAEILNLQVSVVYSPGEIQEAVNKLSDKDLILIDTAGRSHKNKAHFDELKSLVSAVEADETFLVVNCNTSRIALREVLEYYAFVRDYKLLFTKLDEAPVCGIILNARYMTGKSISYTTNGQSVPDDMSVANVKQIVADVLSEDVL